MQRGRKAHEEEELGSIRRVCLLPLPSPCTVLSRSPERLSFVPPVFLEMPTSDFPNNGFGVQVEEMNEGGRYRYNARAPGDTHDCQHDADELAELKQRLAEMKELLSEETESNHGRRARRCSGREGCGLAFCDSQMVSFVFLLVMGLVLCVSVYAFQHLFTAIFQRFFPS
ncbi:unnamed protein product [Darwinula stevensoni]|uniref:Transmembrane protein n=1 Tax=Darwinula stevensoni TaxID=69355 RepID=A0A7R9A3C0_9CRUS|nr:unnamed protein product [Darwinula stevensoni]CAG0881793.1 unnamed protein product [Darwinula stevensoni]